MSNPAKPINSDEQRAVRLTAYALDELDANERSEVEAELDSKPEQRAIHDEFRRIAAELRFGADDVSSDDPSSELRAAVLEQLSEPGCVVELPDSRKLRNVSWRRRAAVVSVSAALLLAVVPLRQMLTQQHQVFQIAEVRDIDATLLAEQKRVDDTMLQEQEARRSAFASLSSGLEGLQEQTAVAEDKPAKVMVASSAGAAGTTPVPPPDQQEYGALEAQLLKRIREQNVSSRDFVTTAEKLESEAKLAAQQQKARQAEALAAQVGQVTAAIDQQSLAITAEQLAQHQANRPTVTPQYGGKPASTMLAAQGVTRQRYAGQTGPFYPYQQTPLGWRNTKLEWDDGWWQLKFQDGRGYVQGANGVATAVPQVAAAWENKPRYGTHWGHYYMVDEGGWAYKPNQPRNEQYVPIVENPFATVTDQPLSTFSIDVDTASYANVRRFLTQNQLPPPNAVRLEELINYFGYSYPQPEDKEPFSVSMEVAQCPWQPAHQVVRIGLKGKEVPRKERPACNLVFLLDVSGSMKDANKLPLLKQAMKLLTEQLNESDRVTIVTYAGDAGVPLDTTHGDNKHTIRNVIDALNADGSTNGSAGIQLAYEKATEACIKDGPNRVILATDGDLNVGITDDNELVKLITDKAKSGVFLTVLGFGEGNLKDGKLEKLADNGNGMYAYVDSLREARKVLVEQITGSLVTIAKDVKIKVEFNPAEVAGYRLLGYENRLMTAAEFNDDKKDAGEIGAGHSVTALYEIIPKGAKEKLAGAAGKLKYQRVANQVEPPKELTDAAKTGELLTVSLRYKQPDEDESTLREFIVKNEDRAFDDASIDFRFAASVASFGMQLRQSKYRGETSFAAIEEAAASAIGDDPQGHRTEFVDLARRAAGLVNKGGK